jgi:hypothetical protein
MDEQDDEYYEKREKIIQMFLSLMSDIAIINDMSYGFNSKSSEMISNKDVTDLTTPNMIFDLMQSIEGLISSSHLVNQKLLAIISNIEIDSKENSEEEIKIRKDEGEIKKVEDALKKLKVEIVNDKNKDTEQPQKNPLIDNAIEYLKNKLLDEKEEDDE